MQRTLYEYTKDLADDMQYMLTTIRSHYDKPGQQICDLIAGVEFLAAQKVILSVLEDYGEDVTEISGLIEESSDLVHRMLFRLLREAVPDIDEEEVEDND